MPIALKQNTKTEYNICQYNAWVICSINYLRQIKNKIPKHKELVRIQDVASSCPKLRHKLGQLMTSAAYLRN